MNACTRVFTLHLPIRPRVTRPRTHVNYLKLHSRELGTTVALLRSMANTTPIDPVPVVTPNHLAFCERLIDASIERGELAPPSSEERSEMHRKLAEEAVTWEGLHGTRKLRRRLRGSELGRSHG